MELAWAVSARNSLSNNSGFSPSQLVFGRNSNLPNVFENSPPALENTFTSDLVRENLNAMHRACEDFLAYDSNERLKRALKYNVRPSKEKDISNGDNVFYKRNNFKEWHGPAVVIGRDGKQFLVRHGGTYVRVHECRLTKSPEFPITRNEANGKELCDRNRVVNNECLEDDEKSDLNEDEGIDKMVEIDDHSKDCEEIYEDAVEESGTNIELEQRVPHSAQMSPKFKSSMLKGGQRLKGVLNETGEILTGRVISRAGKSTGKYKNYFNIKKDDGSTVALDMEKDVTNVELVDDEVEMLVLYSCESVDKAKYKEIENWKANNVYEEVENFGQPFLSVRWIVTEKLKNGEPAVKARLVARGFEEDSSSLRKDSPTCSRESVRLALTIASSHGWNCETIDVKAAYLQGNQISREVFLKPPPEFNNGRLWKLNKTVYGLCDAARQWYLRVKDELIKLGMSVCSVDPALFSYKTNGKFCGIICLYVDDFLWAGTKAFETSVISKLQDLFLIGSKESKAFKYVGLNIRRETGDLTTVDQIDYSKTLDILTISRERNNDKTVYCLKLRKLNSVL